MAASEDPAMEPATNTSDIGHDRKRKRSTSPGPKSLGDSSQAAPGDAVSQEQGLESTGDGATSSTTTPLSKNQQKKLLKKQKWEATRESRRALRREKLAAKRVRQREAKEAAFADPSNSKDFVRRKHTKALERRSKQLNIKCIVDCSFDDYMMEKEVASLGSQVSRCYSDNRIAKFSMKLWLTCVDKRLREHLSLMHADRWKSWKRITITDKDYDLPAEDVEAGNVIYLSSDSDDTLETLDEGNTYIVGGIVDKNRHRGLCFNKAVGQGLRTARLPIGEYIKMTGRVALTTNQVVEIMLRWLELKDWQKAFEMAIPMRKKKKTANAKEEGPVVDGAEEGSLDIGQEEENEIVSEEEELDKHGAEGLYENEEQSEHADEGDSDEEDLDSVMKDQPTSKI